MARADAVCTCATCGKTFTRTAYKYNRREADDWEAWAVKNFDECTACWQARKDRERAEENTRAAEAAKAAGLPDLTGSPKQIAWANTIRQKVLGEIQEYICKRESLQADRRQFLEGADVTAEQRDAGERMIEKTAAIIDALKELLAQLPIKYGAASWWIDHRDEDWRLWTIVQDALSNIR